VGQSSLPVRVGLGLLIVLSLAARVSDPARSDLHPWPDGPEYAATARSLLEHATFKIPFAGQWVPPGHGFGFPLIITPFLAVFGHALENALYATLAMHVVELVLVFLLATRCYGRAAGLLAVAFVAASPLDAELSRRIMSEVPSSAMITGALLVLCGPETVAAPRRLFACGAMLAVATWMRPVNALLGIPIGLVVFFASPPAMAGVRRLGWLLGGFVLGAIPVAAYNLLTLGSVTRVPHSVWVPAHKTLFGPFAFAHALEDGKAARYVAALLGHGDYCLATTQQLYPIFVAALALSAVFLAKGNRPPLSPAAVTLQRVTPPVVAVLLAICSFYFFETELRFLHAAVPLVCIVAAGSAVRLFTPLFARVNGRVASVALCVAALAWPAWSLGRTLLDGPLGRQVAAGEEPSPAFAREHMKLVDAATEPDAWIVSDSFDPLFFSVVETGHRRLLQVDEDGLAADDVRVETLTDVPERLDELLAGGAHVYFVGDPDRARQGRLHGYALTLAASHTFYHGWTTQEVWRLSRETPDGGPGGGHAAGP
jgi:4-amino-4-deoxy-L-arabinose transferase-like glycosyltransferase